MPSHRGALLGDWLTRVQKSCPLASIWSNSVEPFMGQGFLGSGIKLSLNSNESTSRLSHFLCPTLPAFLIPLQVLPQCLPNNKLLIRACPCWALLLGNKSPNQEQCVNPGEAYALSQIPTQISIYNVAGKWNLQISVSIQYLFFSFLMKGIVCYVVLWDRLWCINDSRYLFGCVWCAGLYDKGFSIMAFNSPNNFLRSVLLLFPHFIVKGTVT